MAYEDIVVATAGLTNYWKLGEASGTTATDSQGTNTGAYQGGVTLGQSGLPGSNATAVLLNGSTGYISTATQLASPGPVAPFTLEFWFNTTVKAVLASFGDTQTGAQASVSPETYLDSASGRMYVGTNTTGMQTANTGNGYIDGNWHHGIFIVTATNNLNVVVDGGYPPASNATTQAPSSFAGYWRFGNGIAATYTNASGISAFFSGKLAHIALYNVALSPTTIAQHYNVGRGINARVGPLQSYVRAKLPYGDFRPFYGQLWPRGTK